MHAAVGEIFRRKVSAELTAYCVQIG